MPRLRWRVPPQLVLGLLLLVDSRWLALAQAPKTIVLLGLFSKDFSESHAAIARVAVDQVNADAALLSGTTLHLDDVDIQIVRQAASSDNPMKLCYMKAQLDSAHADTRALIGLGFSSDIQTLRPALQDEQFLVMTHAAADAEFSDKQKHPHVSRLCASASVEARALVEIAKHHNYSAVKIVSCDDEYCQSLATSARSFAAAQGLTVVDELQLPILTFENDPNGRQLARNFLLDCTKTQVILVCTHAHLANKVFDVANSLQEQNSIVWVLASDATLRSLAPVGALGIQIHQPSSFVKSTFIAFGKAAIPTLESILDSDPHAAFARDAVFALAHAFTRFTEAGSWGTYSLSALKSALQQVQFEGVSGRVSFDANLDLVGATFDIRNVQPTGWATVGSWSSAGVAAGSTSIQWPGKNGSTKPMQACFSPPITIGVMLVASVDRPQQMQDVFFDEVYMLSAANLAVRMINANEQLLPNTKLVLRIADTGIQRLLSTQTLMSGVSTGAEAQALARSTLARRLQTESLVAVVQSLNSSEVSDECLVESTNQQRAAAILGPGYTSEIEAISGVLAQTRIPALSPTATQGSRSGDDEWAARMALENDRQAQGLVGFLQRLNFSACTFATCNASDCLGLRQNFLRRAAAASINVTVQDSELFKYSLRARLAPSTCGSRVVVLGVLTEHVQDLFAFMRDQRFETGRLIWLGSAAASAARNLPSGYLGLRPLLDTSLQPYRDLLAFWRAQDHTEFPGLNEVQRQPGILATYDAVFALAHAANAVLLQKGSVHNASALRAALRQVSFLGASGAVSFSQTLDRKEADLVLVNRRAPGHGPWDQLVGAFFGHNHSVSLTKNEWNRIRWPDNTSAQMSVCLCPKGEQSVSSDPLKLTCAPCKRGSYKDSGMKSCRACPGGFMSPEGSTSKSACVMNYFHWTVIALAYWACLVVVIVSRDNVPLLMEARFWIWEFKAATNTQSFLHPGEKSFATLMAHGVIFLVFACSSFAVMSLAPVWTAAYMASQVSWKMEEGLEGASNLIIGNPSNLEGHTSVPFVLLWIFMIIICEFFVLLALIGIRSRLMPAGKYLHRWLLRFELERSLLLRDPNTSCLKDVKPENVNPRGWQFVTAYGVSAMESRSSLIITNMLSDAWGMRTPVIERSGLFSALPRCVRESFAFSEILYYKKHKRGAEIAFGVYPSVEIVQEGLLAGTHQEMQCLKLLCTDSLDGFHKLKKEDWLSAESIQHQKNVSRQIRTMLETTSKTFDRDAEGHKTSAPDGLGQGSGLAWHIMLPKAEGFVFKHERFQQKQRGWAWFRSQIMRIFFREDQSLYFSVSSMPAHVRQNNLGTLLRQRHSFSDHDICSVALTIGKIQLQLHQMRIALRTLDVDVIAIAFDDEGKNPQPVLIDYSSATYIYEDLARRTLDHMCANANKSKAKAHTSKRRKTFAEKSINFQIRGLSSAIAPELLYHHAFSLSLTSDESRARVTDHNLIQKKTSVICVEGQALLKADVYSLGMIMYHMMTGDIGRLWHPFREEHESASVLTSGKADLSVDDMIAVIRRVAVLQAPKRTDKHGPSPRLSCDSCLDWRGSSDSKHLKALVEQTLWLNPKMRPDMHSLVKIQLTRIGLGLDLEAELENKKQQMYVLFNTLPKSFSESLQNWGVAMNADMMESFQSEHPDLLEIFNTLPQTSGPKPHPQAVQQFRAGVQLWLESTTNDIASPVTSAGGDGFRTPLFSQLFPASWPNAAQPTGLSFKEIGIKLRKQKLRSLDSAVNMSLLVSDQNTIELASLADVQKEFQDRGSMVDLQNFDYVLNGASLDTASQAPHLRGQVHWDYRGGALDMDGMRLLDWMHFADASPWNKGKKLEDFCNQEYAKRAQLSLVHVLVLRLFTTCSAKRIMRCHEASNGGSFHFQRTLEHLLDAFGKLRQYGAEQIDEEGSEEKVLSLESKQTLECAIFLKRFDIVRCILSLPTTEVRKLAALGAPISDFYQTSRVPDLRNIDECCHVTFPSSAGKGSFIAELSRCKCRTCRLGQWIANHRELSSTFDHFEGIFRDADKLRQGLILNIETLAADWQLKMPLVREDATLSPGPLPPLPGAVIADDSSVNPTSESIAAPSSAGTTKVSGSGSEASLSNTTQADIKHGDLKFAATVLDFGDSSLAAGGLKQAIGLNDDTVLADLMRLGFDQLQLEFIMFGSLEDMENLYYVCYGIAQDGEWLPTHVKSDIKAGKYHGGELASDDYDYGNAGRILSYFVKHDHSVLAGLSTSNVVALRIYTTSSYKRLNRPLRDMVNPHPFRMTVHFLSEGLRNLRKVAAEADREDFNKAAWCFRGMSGVQIDEVAMKKFGGTERAPMSTTTKLEIAIKYASSRTPSIIFAFRTQGLTKGSSIRYLSVYPKEEEYLYPPLTNMLLDNTFHNPNASEVPGYNVDSDGKPMKAEDTLPDDFLWCLMSPQMS